MNTLEAKPRRKWLQRLKYTLAATVLLLLLVLLIWLILFMPEPMP